MIEDNNTLGAGAESAREPQYNGNGLLALDPCTFAGLAGLLESLPTNAWNTQLLRPTVVPRNWAASHQSVEFDFVISADALPTLFFALSQLAAGGQTSTSVERRRHRTMVRSMDEPWIADFLHRPLIRDLSRNQFLEPKLPPDFFHTEKLPQHLFLLFLGHISGKHEAAVKKEAVNRFRLELLSKNLEKDFVGHFERGLKSLWRGSPALLNRLVWLELRKFGTPRPDRAKKPSARKRRVVAVAGPDGSGKTSMVQSLSGATSGRWPVTKNRVFFRKTAIYRNLVKVSQPKEILAFEEKWGTFLLIVATARFYWHERSSGFSVVQDRSFHELLFRGFRNGSPRLAFGWNHLAQRIPFTEAMIVMCCDFETGFRRKGELPEHLWTKFYSFLGQTLSMSKCDLVLMVDSGGDFLDVRQKVLAELQSRSILMDVSPVGE